MTNKILKEGLDYHDLKGMISNKLTVDEYAAKMGEDSDIVTLSFTVNSKLAAEDLVNWLEIGYDYVLDASVSDGEIEPGKYLVFVEMNRRTNVPARIIEILEDLQTLTDVALEDYDIIVNDVSYQPDVDKLKDVIILSPHEYRVQKENEKELNEYREIAGISTKKIYDPNDKELKRFISSAQI